MCVHSPSRSTPPATIFCGWTCHWWHTLHPASSLLIHYSPRCRPRTNASALHVVGSTRLFWLRAYAASSLPNVHVVLKSMSEDGCGYFIMNTSTAIRCSTHGPGSLVLYQWATGTCCATFRISRFLRIPGERACWLMCRLFRADLEGEEHGQHGVLLTQECIGQSTGGGRWKGCGGVREASQNRSEHVGSRQGVHLAGARMPRLAKRLCSVQFGTDGKL